MTEEEALAYFRTLRPTPDLPYKVWSGIGQLVVQPAIEIMLENEHGLLLTYRKDEHWDGWHVPGGFQSPGESLQDTVTRIARRELGITVKYERVHDVVHWPTHPYVNALSLFCKCSTTEKPVDGTYFKSPPQVVIPVHKDFLATYLRG